MASETPVQLHSDRGASLRLLVITAIFAMLAAGFVASIWRAPEPPPVQDTGEPAEPAQEPVALR